ncbi:hypothetical protein A3K78_07025 [Candidatus Bathyarchaeota archaeon RBG_13_52_12]|nr:MAG: hypothetical protein A3K78_07025 [Candidatus Bathyarchaeota archaeon RBG_13_52_12]
MVQIIYIALFSSNFLVKVMKGAIVFLVVFVLGVIITLGNTSLPPGSTIYGMLNVPSTNYPVLGIPATTLIISVINGVVYGFIAWLAFTIVWSITGRNKNTQNVNVYVDGKKQT